MSQLIIIFGFISIVIQRIKDFVKSTFPELLWNNQMFKDSKRASLENVDRIVEILI